MFRSAKIKLTALYLFMIMTITLSFSVVVYRGVVGITEKALESQRVRIERRFRDTYFQGPNPRPNMPQMFDSETLIEIRNKTLDVLTFVNLVIFFGAGAIGYYIAGKTLEPIEKMTKQQKRFISDAAHELKTPLTAIKTELEVTERDKNLDTKVAREAIASTIEEIDKLNEFIAKLLRKSKYQNGKHFEKSKVNLTKLLDSLTEKYTKTAKKHSQTITFTGPTVYIDSDEAALEELFTNLIDNAIKYNRNDGNVKVEILKHTKSVEVRISDDGIGIAEDDIGHIFEPFYRANKSRSKTNIDGYGLGLSISKDIIEKLNGHITVKSREGEGSTFTVFIPATEA